MNDGAENNRANWTVPGCRATLGDFNLRQDVDKLKGINACPHGSSQETNDQETASPGTWVHWQDAQLPQSILPSATLTPALP
jgi:hypothetical protein